jgi:hypothetical protein
MAHDEKFRRLVIKYKDSGRNVAALIPHGQYTVTIEHIEAFEEALTRLEEQLKKCPELRTTDGMKEPPAIFHYFCGATDIYIYLRV